VASGLREHPVPPVLHRHRRVIRHQRKDIAVMLALVTGHPWTSILIALVAFVVLIKVVA
jgi:hypothetical protein